MPCQQLSGPRKRHPDPFFPQRTSCVVGRKIFWAQHGQPISWEKLRKREQRSWWGGGCWKSQTKFRSRKKAGHLSNSFKLKRYPLSQLCTMVWVSGASPRVAANHSYSCIPRFRPVVRSRISVQNRRFLIGCLCHHISDLSFSSLHLICLPLLKLMHLYFSFFL